MSNLDKKTNEQELRTPYELARYIVDFEFHSPKARYKSAIELTAHYEQLITAHTNAEIAKVLERLEAELNEQKKAAETNLAYHVDVTKNERLIRDWQGTVHGIEFCRPAIAAERAKLKEVK